MPLDVPLEDGDLPHVTRALLAVGNPELAMQRARIRLQTFRGEVPSDASAGIPYVEIASGSKATSAMRRAFALLIRSELEAIDDIDRVTLSESFDPEARRLTTSIDVLLSGGERRGIVLSPLGVTGDPRPRIE